MKEVSVKNARSRFGRILQDVEQGNVTEITRYGKPIARIVPIPQKAKTLPSLKEFRKSQPKPAKSLTETLLEMRAEERD